MTVELVRQNNFNNGEMSPHMAARRDVKTYYSSVAWMENFVTSPAGPMFRRPGTTFIDYARHKMTDLDLTAATLAAPSGGDASELVLMDGEPLETTADLGDADQVLLTITFPAPVTVYAVDLVDYAAKDGVDDPIVPPFEYPWDQVPYIYVPF